MANPTLVYGGTTVPLPYPSREGRADRTYDERSVARRTVGGKLRTQVLSRGYVYRLGFTWELVSTYDAIVALWAAATAANAYPTFTWSGGPWSTVTAGVTVAIAISPMPMTIDYTRTDWTLDLVEVEPR
jgi:hypothetical protein